MRLLLTLAMAMLALSGRAPGAGTAEKIVKFSQVIIQDPDGVDARSAWDFAISADAWRVTREGENTVQIGNYSTASVITLNRLTHQAVETPMASSNQLEPKLVMWLPLPGLKNARIVSRQNFGEANDSGIKVRSWRYAV